MSHPPSTSSEAEKGKYLCLCVAAVDILEQRKRSYDVEIAFDVMFHFAPRGNADRYPSTRNAKLNAMNRVRMRFDAVKKKG